MSNNYSQLIDILAGGVDLRAVALEVAKGQPSAFVSAYERLKQHGASHPVNLHTATGWEEHGRALLQAGRKVEAIKWCRNCTGMSLMRAKEAVEALA